MNNDELHQRHINNIIRALHRVIRLYDQGTAEHCARVARLSFRLALDLSLPDNEVRQAYDAGMLHDVGKIFVPLDIIRKPSKLATEEMGIIRNHAQWGCEILNTYDEPYLNQISVIIDAHHEHVDGSGYLKNLNGCCIPKLSRIVAIADSYDAIMELRAYHDRKNSDEAVEIMLTELPNKFDKQYLDVFINKTLKNNDDPEHY